MCSFFVPEKLKFVVHARQLWTAENFRMTSNQLGFVAEKVAVGEFGTKGCNVDVSNGRDDSLEPKLTGLLGTRGSTIHDIYM